MADLQQLAREELARERARRAVELGTVQLLAYRSPQYQPARWHWQIGRECDRLIAGVLAGRGPWEAWGAPPRHGKSEHAGRGMPARLMALAPGASVLYATSTGPRAVEVSMAVRRLVEELARSGAFPHLAPHPDGPWTQTEWRTIGGNTWVGVGSGAATGGIGADAIILDDVTGSEERQRSSAWKAGARSWLQGDVLTRGKAGFALLAMETRRGLDDIQGWLKAEYPGRLVTRTWTCRAEEGDPWGRAPGAYLWPERTATGWGGYDAAWHASRPDLQGGRIWETQYQQRPVVEGGEVIRTEWTAHRYDGDPVAVRSGCSRVMLFCDPSSTSKDRSDPTAIQVWGLRGRHRLLLHAEVLRPDDLTRRLADLQAAWRAEGIALEATSIGPEIARALQRGGLRGVLTLPVSGRGDKVARMTPHLPSWAAGDVLLPQSAPWVARYVGEVTTVPSSPHDDEWDCTSLALAYYADHDTARATPMRGIW